MKGLFRFLPWWMVVVALLLGIVWSYRTDFVRIIIRHAIELRQVEIVDFEIADIDFSSAMLDHLSVEITTMEGKLVFQGESIKTDYSLENIWQGTLQSFSAEKMTVFIPGETAEATGQLDVSNLASGLASILAVNLPIHSMEIQSLIVEHGNPVISSQFPASLSIQPHSLGEKIRLTNRLWDLEALRTPDTLSGVLSENRGPDIAELSLSANREPSGKVLSIKGEVETRNELLNNLLHEFQFTALDYLTGKTEISFTAQPTDRKWQIGIQGKLSGYHSGVMELHEIEFDTNMVIPSQIPTQPLILEIPSPGRLSAKTLLTETIKVNQLRWQPEGSVSITDSQIDISLTENSNLSFTNLDSSEFEAGQTHMVTNLDASYSGDVVTVQTGPSASVSVDAIESSGFNLKNLDATLDLELSYSRDSFVVNTGTGTRLRVLTINADNLEIQELNASPVDTSSITVQTGDSSTGWSVSEGQWRFQHPRITLDDVACEAGALIVEPLDFSGSRGQANLQAEEPECNIAGINHAFDEIAAILEMDNRDLRLSGQFIHSALPPEFSFDININLDSGVGDLSLSHDDPVDMSVYAGELKEIMELDIPELEFNEGQLLIRIQGRQTVPGQISGTLLLDLVDASGEFQEVSFAGLSVNGSLDYPSIESFGSARINVQQLQYGVDIENVQAEFDMVDESGGHAPTFHFRSLEGEFLGSTLKADDFDFNPVTLDGNVRLHVAGLELARIVELQQFEGLEVSGKLDGDLPITISKGEVSIVGGRLNSQPEGGMINYVVDPSLVESVSNPLTDTVMKALTDFSYQVLSADVDYQPNGDMYVDFQIQGSSPNLESGRPVHLNINSEQNVLSLLKSLEYTGNLNEDLDEVIRNNPLLQSGNNRKDDESN